MSETSSLSRSRPRFTDVSSSHPPSLKEKCNRERLAVFEPGPSSGHGLGYSRQGSAHGKQTDQTSTRHFSLTSTGGLVSVIGEKLKCPSRSFRRRGGEEVVFLNSKADAPFLTQEKPSLIWRRKMQKLLCTYELIEKATSILDRPSLCTYVDQEFQ